MRLLCMWGRLINFVFPNSTGVECTEFINDETTRDLPENPVEGRLLCRRGDDRIQFPSRRADLHGALWHQRGRRGTIH